MSLLVAAITPDENHLFKVDQILDGNALVANAGPVGASVEASEYRPVSDQISVYKVRSGDTLSQIAEMFGVNVNTIKWGNNLTSNTLREGQTLVILPISGVKYIVKKGDTLDSIAKKFNGDTQEIVAFNNLEDGPLVVGITIIIPDGELSSPPSSSSSHVAPSSAKEYVGFYIKPVAGRRTQGIHGHNGIDIAAPVGTTVYAAADGEVIVSRSSGWNGGYGAYIVIKHNNGTQTLYAHNSQNFVSVGESVQQGQAIGAVGSTGKSTGAHLHFEVRGAKNPF